MELYPHYTHKILEYKITEIRWEPTVMARRKLFTTYKTSIRENHQLYNKMHNSVSNQQFVQTTTVPLAFIPKTSIFSSLNLKKQR
jgi:hypothetical protein